MAGYSYANKYLIYLLHHHLQIFIQQKDCYKNTQLGIGNSAYFLTICINFPQVKLRSFLVQLECVQVWVQWCIASYSYLVSYLAI